MIGGVAQGSDEEGDGEGGWGDDDSDIDLGDLGGDDDEVADAGEADAGCVCVAEFSCRFRWFHPVRPPLTLHFVGALQLLRAADQGSPHQDPVDPELVAPCRLCGGRGV